MTLVPVPTKTARSHSDIKGRRPFDVPASVSFHVMFLGCDVANPRTTMPFLEPEVKFSPTYDIFGKPSSFSRSTTTRSTLGLIV